MLWLAVLCVACGTTEPKASSGAFTVKNDLASDRPDAVLTLEMAELKAAFPEITDWTSVQFGDEKALPYQLSDRDGDGQAEAVQVLVSLAPNAERTIPIRSLPAGEMPPDFPKRTQAELSHKIDGTWKNREYEGGRFQNVEFLRVPPEHTDHSWFIRYEGPGWESDRVGYRFYLDWRNATDIFGKKTPEMVLQNVGQDGFDSYHEPADWGMDILKVGSSLGIGALGIWQQDTVQRVATTDSITCRIVENGPVESLVRTVYYGWQTDAGTTDLTSELSIQAGSRLTRHDIALSNALPNLCTGIVKLETGQVFSATDGAWSYLATWGPQSLAEDDLGMAVLFRTADLIQLTEDAHSHVAVLRPSDRQLTYYFLAAWSQEPNGIRTESAFRAYLDRTLAELATPAVVVLPQPGTDISK